MKRFFPLFLAFALGAEAQTGNTVKVNVENDAVARYLSEVDYTSTEDASQIGVYNVAPPAIRSIPRPALIPIPESDAKTLLLTYADDADFTQGVITKTVAKGSREYQLYNLAPRREYYYKVEADGKTVDSGVIQTEGRVRMIYVPGANNIRDLGGWPSTDGQRTKYGKLFRGTELNGLHVVDSAGLAILTNDLGIQAEIDMRAWYNDGHGVSAFGFASNMWGNTAFPPYYYTSDSGQGPNQLSNRAYRLKWKREFDFIVQNFVKARNVYMHCVHGADRTGYFAFLIEGLMGLEYGDMVKDYELTDFYSFQNKKETIDSLYNYIMRVEGSTQQEKFRNFFTDSLNVSPSNIDYFLGQMLEKDDLVTAIRSAEGHNGEATQTQAAGLRPATYDLWGRKATKAGRKGIVIEQRPDGTVRKVMR